MEGETTLDGFLMWKWMEEDDDDFNLIIIDERRAGIEQKMQEALGREKPLHHDDFGNAYYDIATLTRIWESLTVKGEREQ